MLTCICFTASDWISIVSLLVTSGIGVWIGCVVQKNITTTRAVKDYYIQEIKEIRHLYVCFFNELHQGKKSSTGIKDWLKIMSSRIDSVENSITNYFRISDSKIKDIHRDFQIYITGTDDFNENFKEPLVNFQENVKNEILKVNTSLTDALMNRVISINGAKKR